MKALQDDMFFDLWDDVDEDQLQSRQVELGQDDVAEEPADVDGALVPKTD